ncbi:alpha/beta hydrolase [Lysinibacillus sp. 1 U-2021]|uniref:alpha/beta hydrolase n=1 Tax=Lysinibacillus sp. 1 U-2021 TaxID=3039426 RepID=UPI00247FEB93|nr:alpha/beta hydrolase [Lysinibacillus sp. 1 U-2021]WGT40416.1 alpha/beta hydrolase [Lysinibacillus sp. 1 U-2021]
MKCMKLGLVSAVFAISLAGCATSGIDANTKESQTKGHIAKSAEKNNFPKVVLEPEAQAFADATKKPPYLFDLGPEEGRKTVDKVQSGPVEKLPVDIEDTFVEGGKLGKISVRIFKPKNSPDNLPVILYTHGAGWVFGNAHTHDRLARELAVGSNSVVVFTNYSLSPEAKYPTAIEEVYTVLNWVSNKGKNYGMNPNKISVAGDSVGGNMSAAITLMAKERKGPKIEKQLLFYPVTDASFNTNSYKQFKEGYFLRKDAMKWFWDQYTTSEKERNEITASPLRATVDQLKGLPKALIITAEADVLRDEGEAYANKLRDAGVDVTAVRFQGMIHDFVMLNDLAKTEAARGAIDLSTTWLRK